MRSYALNEARSAFSAVFERALAGEPQRVTRHGKEAVIIVSEDAWNRHSRSAPSLGALLADFAERSVEGAEVFAEKPFRQVRPLGSEFSE